MSKKFLIYVLPLGIVLFFLYSKWWHVAPVDARDTVMRGFPFPYVAQAWHTSMAYQFFMVEFIIDFLFYLGIAFIMVYFFFRFEPNIKMAKYLKWFLWLPCFICLLLAILFLSDPNHLFYGYRSFEYKVIDSGFDWIWEKHPI